jgi:AraC-like DNA-binding protein
MTDTKYNSGHDVAICCKILKVDIDTVLNKSNLDADQSTLLDLTFSAHQFFNILNVIVGEYGKDDFHVKIPNGYSQYPNAPAIVSFASSLNIREAIKRICQVKQTLTPMFWTTDEAGDHFNLKLESAHTDYPLDGFTDIMSFIWIVKTCRNYTLENIKPTRIVISGDVPYRTDIANDLGCEIEVSSYSAMQFDNLTADIPVLTNKGFISDAINQKKHPLDTQMTTNRSVVVKTEEAIKNCLASGDVSAERISSALAMSRRTFERRLSEEGVTFRKILKEIRSDLALEYLSDKNYSISEISFLLGFEEPNSFFRAFKQWHGSTPQQIRALQVTSH